MFLRFIGQDNMIFYVQICLTYSATRKVSDIFACYFDMISVPLQANVWQLFGLDSKISHPWEPLIEEVFVPL